VVFRVADKQTITPIAPQTLQTEKVQKSHTLRSEAKKLLEIAKRTKTVAKLNITNK